MTGEWIVAKHVIERGLESLRRDLPGHKRAIRQIRREQSLPHPTNRSSAEHGRDARHHDLDRHTGTTRNFLKWFAHEAADLVLRDGKDLLVHRIVVFDGQHARPN